MVLLDEYQDTSVVQTDLLAAAFRDAAVMAVGDPHQSIYGWRGASAASLAGFAEAFATEQVPVAQRSLSTSWRNDQAVLEVARETDAALIVVGVRHRSPVGKALMGSVGQRILLDARCPVLAVKPDA